VTRLGIPLLLALLLTAPIPALAATYKCTVNGQTVYQQSPCADGDSQELKLKPNNPGGAGGGSYSAGDVAKMRLEVQNKGPRLARDAFDRLASGNVGLYAANLCPRERQQWSNPSMQGSLSAMGRALASDGLKLGRHTEVMMDSMTFIAVQDPGARGHDSNAKPRMRTVRAHFGRDLGQLCLRVLDIGV
jgi:Domain of unknown function (DUF4124)